MLNKTWTFALALALAAAPVSSLLAAGGAGAGGAGAGGAGAGGAGAGGAGGGGAGASNGENATAGTAAANAIHRRRRWTPPGRSLLRPVQATPRQQTTSKPKLAGGRAARSPPAPSAARWNSGLFGETRHNDFASQTRRRWCTVLGFPPEK